MWTPFPLNFTSKYSHVSKTSLAPIEFVLWLVQVFFRMTFCEFFQQVQSRPITSQHTLGQGSWCNVRIV
uniref:Ovule protein n=1 Tax=Parascaris univalens TaxID=6257 RepID=A0A915C622_PARUN